MNGAYLYVFTQPLHHKQNVTQDQFLAGMNSEIFFLIGWLPYQGQRTQSAQLFSHNRWGNKRWIHAFPTGIVKCKKLCSGFELGVTDSIS